MSSATAWRLPPAALSVLLAVGLVVVVFPEVVFLGGSLSPSGLDDVVNRAADRRTVQVYPSLENFFSPEVGANVGPPSWQVGMRDIGAMTWQLVPATKFMHRAIWDGQSPFWNPYSAAGSLGVETIVDIKMSPLVIAVAALGASATAFTFVTLAFVVLALYCLQQFFTRTLGVGRLAATAACIVFLLNGFAASDINSQIGAPYVLFPVVLYTLAEHVRRGGPTRLLLALAAYAALLCTTFWTVGVLMLLLVHCVVLVLDVSRDPDGSEPAWSRISGAIGRHAIVPVIALLATAYIWLPVFDALRHSGGDISAYGARTLRAKDPLALLTILTPSHLFHAPDINSYFRYLKRYDWTVYLGITPLVLLAASWPRAHSARRRLFALSLGLGIFGLVELAGLPVLRDIGQLPALRTIRQEYWGVLAAAAMVLAIGVGVANFVEDGVSALRAGVAGAFCATAFAVALFATRHVPITDFAKVSISISFLLIFAVLALVILAARHPAHRGLVATVAVALMGIELLSYQPHVRLNRLDLDNPAPHYVAFLRHNLHGSRILNAGRQGIYPEWGAVFRIPQIETINSTQLPDYRDFYLRWVNPKSGGFLQNPLGSQFVADPSALDLLSVRYLVVDDSMPAFERGVRAAYPLAFTDHRAGVRIYENPDAFPRAYLSPTLLTLAQKTNLRYVGAAPFDRKTTSTTDQALLNAAGEAGIPSHSSDATSPGTARVTRYRNDEVDVEVEAAKPAILVLTDTYQKNWHTTVNGHDRHLGRVDSTMRGLVVPAGHSTVVFRYSSPARHLGALVSLVGIGLAMALAAVYAQRSRRAKMPRWSTRETSSDATGAGSLSEPRKK